MQIILSLVLLPPKNRMERCQQFCTLNRLIKTKVYRTYSSLLPVQVFHWAVRNARFSRPARERKRIHPHSVVQCDYLFGSKKCFQIICFLPQTYFCPINFSEKFPRRLCRRDWNLGFLHLPLSLADSCMCLCLSLSSFFMPSLDSA